MTLGPVVQIVAFGLFAFLAIAGALGMTTTMSMFRSGIFLMASFIGVAGLFILLSADLLGLLQVMMYIGGMLVMILFMVLFMQDPGGAMMASMDMAPLEKLFTRGIPPQPMNDGTDVDGAMQHGAMQEHHGDHQDGAHDDDQHGEMQHSDMDMGMMDMTMTTPLKRPAAILAAVVGALLVALVLLRPAWPLSGARPAPDSAAQVGQLMMGKYMLGFEGAGLLILVGIFGAVYLARPGAFPDAADRQARVAIDATPASAGFAALLPLLRDAAPNDGADIDVVAAHHDEGN